MNRKDAVPRCRGGENQGGNTHENNPVRFAGSGPLTKVILFGNSWTECGYCHGSRAFLVNRPVHASSQSYTIVISRASLTPSWYQSLIHAGWRRSGPAIYKPDNASSCCPLTSIRLPVQDFSPSKSQEKLLKKVANLATATATATPASEKGMVPPTKIKHNKKEKSSSLSPPPPPGVSLLSSGTTDAKTPEKKKQKQYENVASSSSSSKDNTINNNKQTTTTTTFAGRQQKIKNEQHRHRQQQQHRLAMEQCGILETVASWIRQGLSELLASSQVEIPPVKLRLQLRRGNSGSSGKEWTAVSTVCAAMAGPSQGVMDRGQLSSQLAQTLENRGLLNVSATLAGADNSSMSSSSCTVSITRVDAHEASGQLVVCFCVSCVLQKQQQQQQQQQQRQSREASGLDQKNDTHVEMPPSPSSSKTDALADWWKSECLVTHSLQSQSPPPPLLDRTIGVETMTAFDSCLDPEVYQLYAKYQTEVHGDPDPFHDNLDEFFQSEEVTAEGGGSDPWQTFESRHAECLPQTTLLSPADGSVRGGGPWLRQLQQVLYREYQNLPLLRQQRLWHFVIRFCEYYVVSPFSTTQQQQQQQQQQHVFVNATKETTGTFVNSSLPTKIPFGTYHQQYRVNGKLIAVGVLDVLPQGLSSVYLFYHPTFSRQVVALGKYCALQEILYCRDTLKLPYYFLGYYLHSNTKMSYKADYKPSELLCPKTGLWVPAAKGIARMIANKPRYYCPSLVDTDDDNHNGEGKEEDEEEDDDDQMKGVVERMQLQVNGNHLFRLCDLAPDGQAYLRPLLLPFCRAAGRDACLECIVDLG